VVARTAVATASVRSARWAFATRWTGSARASPTSTAVEFATNAKTDSTGWRTQTDWYSFLSIVLPAMLLIC
jgi:hypothetical protein